MTAFALMLTSMFPLLDAPTTDLGRSLAMRDDAGVVALTWDGTTARAYREGQLAMETEASSWEAAKWSVDLPAYGEVSAPHYYDWALAPTEIKSLGDCLWERTPQPMECGMSKRCDCATSQVDPVDTVAAMASMH